MFLPSNKLFNVAKFVLNFFLEDIDLIIVWEPFPETLKTAIPDLPLCVERAKIVSLEAFIFWELNPRWY
jgi:hypothetical protein